MEKESAYSVSRNWNYMTDQDEKTGNKISCFERKKERKKRQFLLRGERRSSQVLSSQPLEAERETEGVNIAGPAPFPRVLVWIFQTGRQKVMSTLCKTGVKTPTYAVKKKPLFFTISLCLSHAPPLPIPQKNLMYISQISSLVGMDR